MKTEQEQLDITIQETKNSVGLLNELQIQLELGCSALLPATRKYLEEVRSVRMAFSNEVVQIIQTVRQLNEITKTNKQIGELAAHIDSLNKVLNSDSITILRKFLDEKEHEIRTPSLGQD